MPSFSAQHLAIDCAGAWHAGVGVAVTGFSIDTRTLRAGDLFVALRTGKRDGHEFVAAAAERGAAAALVAHPVVGVEIPQLVVADPQAALQSLAAAHRARFAGRVIAVTGTAGKTSTKDLLAVLLGEGNEVLATEGNLNNHLGVPLTLLRLEPAQHHAAVVEAGISGPGEMDVIAALIAPDVAVITNVGPAHLDGLGSVDGVAHEKARLAAHVADEGVVVFPEECLRYRAFRDLRQLVFVAGEADTAASVDLPPHARRVPFTIRHETDATHVEMMWDGAWEAFVLRRVTAGMATNAVLALAAALHLGLPADALRERVSRWRPAALRGEVHRAGGRTVYVDCYNANPVSMSDALEAFIALAPAGAPRLFVIGCMEELGSEAASLHRAAGEAWPLRAQDSLLVFGSQAGELAAGARRVAATADVRVNPDRTEAARIVREFPGAVFVKGSRRHALESLLERDSTDDDPTHHREVAA